MIHDCVVCDIKRTLIKTCTPRAPSRDFKSWGNLIAPNEGLIHLTTNQVLTHAARAKGSGQSKSDNVGQIMNKTYSIKGESILRLGRKVKLYRCECFVRRAARTAPSRF